MVGMDAGGRHGRTVAAVLASALAAVVLPVLPIAPAPSAAAAPAACAPVLLVGARGSGAPQAGDDSDGRTGLGPEVRAAGRLLQRKLPAGSVETVAVQYPALPVTALRTDPVAYVSGLEQGVTWTERLLAERAAACPAQRVVLMGYSQGAMVMHRVVQDLVASGSAGAPVLARLDGAVLLADGDRDATDGTRRWGTARRGVGIARQYAALAGARATPLPAALARRVHSVCDRGDLVCDVTGASGPSAGGGDVHTTHYDASRPVRRAVAVVADRVAASVDRGR